MRKKEREKERERLVARYYNRAHNFICNQADPSEEVADTLRYRGVDNEGTWYIAQIREDGKKRWNDWKIWTMPFYEKIPKKATSFFRDYFGYREMFLMGESEEEVFDAMIALSDPMYRNLPKGSELRVLQLTNELKVTKKAGEPIPSSKITTIKKFQSFSRKSK